MCIKFYFVLEFGLIRRSNSVAKKLFKALFTIFQGKLIFFPSFRADSTDSGFVETIHKKNGRLHIYVRQDKYKGELKSHNWVGRTYIDGKQKIVSSGTTDLEKATLILEKWFDGLQTKKGQKEAVPTIEDNITKTEANIAKIEDDISVKDKNKEISHSNQKENIPPLPESKTGVFDKLKNIKFSKANLGKKEALPKTSVTVKKNKFQEKIQNFFPSGKLLFFQNVPFLHPNSSIKKYLSFRLYFVLFNIFSFRFIGRYKNKYITNSWNKY